MDTEETILCFVGVAHIHNLNKQTKSPAVPHFSDIVRLGSGPRKRAFSLHIFMIFMGKFVFFSSFCFKILQSYVANFLAFLNKKILHAICI